MTKKRTEPKRYRIGMDVSEAVKNRILQQAQARGYDELKHYLLHLLENDRDALAQAEASEAAKRGVQGDL